MPAATFVLCAGVSIVKPSQLSGTLYLKSKSTTGFVPTAIPTLLSGQLNLNSRGTTGFVPTALPTFGPGKLRLLIKRRLADWQTASPELPPGLGRRRVRLVRSRSLLKVTIAVVTTRKHGAPASSSMVPVPKRRCSAY